MRMVLRAAMAAVLVCAASAAGAEQTVWRFDNLSRIGGMSPKVEGSPQLVTSPVGRAVQFNGSDTALFFPGRPLVGAKAFTIEAVFRPEGGDFQQRWMHIAETIRPPAWTPIRAAPPIPIPASCSKSGW
jgi:hypothetical protein